MDDLIRRQAILDMLEDINNHIIDGYGYKHDWCVEWVNGLPSIDAVKHGRWKNISFLTVECSECKTQIHDLEYSNFCPNCGARMDGGENDGT